MTDRDDIVGRELDRHVPATGWESEWPAVVERTSRRPRRPWVMATAVTGTAVVVFGALALAVRPGGDPSAAPAGTTTDMTTTGTTAVDTTPTVTTPPPGTADTDNIDMEGGPADPDAARRFVAALGPTAGKDETARLRRQLAHADVSSLVHILEPLRGKRRYVFNTAEGFVCLTTDQSVRTGGAAVCMTPAAAEGRPIVITTARSPGRPANEDVFGLLPPGATAPKMTSDQGDHPIHTDGRGIHGSLPVSAANARLHWTGADGEPRSTPLWDEPPPTKDGAGPG